MDDDIDYEFRKVHRELKEIRQLLEQLHREVRNLTIDFNVAEDMRRNE